MLAKSTFDQKLLEILSVQQKMDVVMRRYGRCYAMVGATLWWVLHFGDGATLW